jgi:hypothetical protein
LGRVKYKKFAPVCAEKKNLNLKKKWRRIQKNAEEDSKKCGGGFEKKIYFGEKNQICPNKRG